MAVMEHSELDASSLADLHAIADQLGLDGFRRLRKGELIDAILARGATGSPQPAGGAEEQAEPGTEEGDEEETPRRPSRRRRSTRTRQASGAGEEDAEASEAEASEAGASEAGASEAGASAGRAAPGKSAAGKSAAGKSAAGKSAAGKPAAGKSAAGKPAAGKSAAGKSAAEASRREEQVIEGVVELLGNGSAFLRVSPPEPSDEDLYISAAQVRRCELVSGDRVSGPRRAPRPSERYPSLARVDTINGAPAESVAEGTRYEDLAVVHPCERLELDPHDPTLGAIEWLTPIGCGSRVVIAGAARSGKSETLRRLLVALAGRSSIDQKGGLEVMLVLSGVRPEEVAGWREGPVAPAAAVDFAASADLQSQTVEHVVETAKRVATRGADVVVLIDSLDGLHPHTARRVLAAARNLADGGSLTVIATATRPLGGESTLIALDVTLTSTGRLPALDLMASGTLRPELLVGEEGAAAITKARADAAA